MIRDAKGEVILQNVLILQDEHDNYNLISCTAADSKQQQESGGGASFLHILPLVYCEGNKAARGRKLRL